MVSSSSWAPRCQTKAGTGRTRQTWGDHRGSWDSGGCLQVHIPLYIESTTPAPPLSSGVSLDLNAIEISDSLLRRPAIVPFSAIYQIYSFCVCGSVVTSGCRWWSKMLKAVKMMRWAESVQPVTRLLHLFRQVAPASSPAFAKWILSTTRPPQGQRWRSGGPGSWLWRATRVAMTSLTFKRPQPAPPVVLEADEQRSLPSFTRPFVPFLFFLKSFL